ncbi:histidine phosphatase family protein [Kineosporia sp. J2-2]|uniref:Histidine phosphatase family protein n=1 Tax=Kineosporia corallincola TaxID=2835133 RepID=A0ABS5TBC0_9ACTN|nr:histidine phosphatase family protein [Kineosporia corallincola]MBT0768355.1 histidine phosphatase family protein [Kineosporia corallincola]
MSSTTLYLVRRGEQHHPTHQADDGEPAEPGSGLTPRGRAQSLAVARRLAGIPFGSVHHSPLRRATETAALITEHLNTLSAVGAVDAGNDQHLRAHACELVRDRTPIPDDHPPRYRQFLQAVPPAERDPQARELRVAVRELSRIGERERTDLIVTHNFVIGWFVRHVLEAPEWRWIGLNQANGAVTVLRWETGRPAALLAFNDTGHLPS